MFVHVNQILLDTWNMGGGGVCQLLLFNLGEVIVALVFE